MKIDYQRLWELPDLPTVQSYSVIPGKRLLIPVFTCVYYGTHVNLEAPLGQNRIDAFAKSALWSWYSWREYTDAKRLGVQVSIYLEDCLKNRLLPLFERNGLRFGSDVIVFSAEGEPHDWARLGKQMHPYWDERFACDDYLIVSDSDFYVARSGFQLFSFFQGKSDVDSKIGFCRLRRGTQAVCFPNNRILLGCLANEIFISKEDPLEVVNSVAGCDIYSKILVSDNLIHPLCCLWSYPAQYMHKNEPDFIAFMKRAARLIGSDQLSAVIWHELFNYSVFSLEELFGVNVRGIYNLRRTNKCQLLHGRPLSEEAYQRFKELIGVNYD